MSSEDFDPTAHELIELLADEQDADDLAELLELWPRIGPEHRRQLVRFFRLVIVAELFAEVVTGRPRLRRKGRPSPD